MVQVTLSNSPDGVGGCTVKDHNGPDYWKYYVNRGGPPLPRHPHQQKMTKSDWEALRDQYSNAARYPTPDPDNRRQTWRQMPVTSSCPPAPLSVAQRAERERRMNSEALWMIRARAGVAKTEGGALHQKRRLPASLASADSETKTKGWVGGQARLVIGVTTSNDCFLVHCGSLPAKMVTLNEKLEGLRYALLVHLIVFSSQFLDDCPNEKSAMLALIPTAAAALEKTLTPGVFTSSEWNHHILNWFPTGPNNVVRRDATLPSTAEEPGCTLDGLLPEGVAATDVQWQVITMDLNELEQWSKRIEVKAKKWFAWVWKEVVQGDGNVDIDSFAQALGAEEWER